MMEKNSTNRNVVRKNVRAHAVYRQTVKRDKSYRQAVKRGWYLLTNRITPIIVILITFLIEIFLKVPLPGYIHESHVFISFTVIVFFPETLNLFTKDC